jgi:hypothetical protein
MPFHRATIHRASTGPASTLATLFCLSLLTTLATSQLRAQAIDPQQPPSSDDHPYTLHVYTRLVQVPTLVLSHDRKQLPPIDPQKFNLSIDFGPRFHATHVRREGDDPITLAILLDVSGDESDLLLALTRNFSAWLSASLKPQDRVTLYAVDCSLLKTSDNAPPDPSTLQQSLDLALTSPHTHGKKNRPSCSGSIPLRDAIALAMQSLSRLPGRRVLLVLSSGYDSRSTVSAPLLNTIATHDAVTIFGLSTPDLVHVRDDNVLDLASESSGGLHLQTSPNKLLKALENFIDLLRMRYILEFPTPANGTAGIHEIQVTVAHTSAFITTSGVNIALPNPAIEQDSLTIHNDNPDAPVIGKHKRIPNP